MYYRLSRFFFLMIRRPPRSTLDRSSAASDVYKRQGREHPGEGHQDQERDEDQDRVGDEKANDPAVAQLSLIHISEPTRPY